MKTSSTKFAISDDSIKTVVLVSNVARYYRTLIDRELEPFGVTRSQWWALSTLYFHDGVTQIELANLLNIGKSSTGKLLTKLEEKGWIARVPDESDGRAIKVQLTEDIRPVIERLVDLTGAIVSSVLEDFSREESRTLVMLLGKLSKGFSRQGLYSTDIDSLRDDLRHEAEKRNLKMLETL
ncbi:MAG: MarR family transcriptional regulator [Porticoccaceae bacterium]